MLYFCGRIDPPLVESLVLQFRETGEVGIDRGLDDPLNFVMDSWIDNDRSKE
jgi:hypothetical protein